MPLVWRCAEWIFGNQRAGFCNLVCQVVVLRGVDAINSVAQKGHRAALYVQRTTMSGRIDTLSEAADNGVAAFGQVT